MLDLIKGLHVVLATLSIGAFLLRGYWMAQGSALLERRETRAAAGTLDAVLIVTGVILALGLTINPVAETWLAAKLIAIVVYVVLGIAALKVGRRNKPAGGAVFALAVLAFAYVVTTAITKNPPFVA